MLNIMNSESTEPNPKLKECDRGQGSNLDWMEANLAEGEQRATLLLVGGVDTMHFRIRIAQAHLRHDFSPSSWSHVALLGSWGNDLAATRLHEISLAPRHGFGFPAPDNAVQLGSLADYADSARYPNLALVHLPVAPDKLEKALARFRTQRMVLDAAELLLIWLAFAWGVGRTGNPLFDAKGLPSAAMLDVVLGAAGFDITPGLESRASCPEAIWQAVRWWHAFYGSQARDIPEGVWTAPHGLVPNA